MKCIRRKTSINSRFCLDWTAGLVFSKKKLIKLKQKIERVKKQRERNKKIHLKRNGRKGKTEAKSLTEVNLNSLYVAAFCPSRNSFHFAKIDLKFKILQIIQLIKILMYMINFNLKANLNLTQK